MKICRIAMKSRIMCMFSDIVRSHSRNFIDTFYTLSLGLEYQLKLTTQGLNFTVQDQDMF